MNCDEVFAILTRGPFPSGDRHDRLVEAHLQFCLDCQRLAEALRPNDENRPEAVAPEDTVSLPGYWGGPLDAASYPMLSLAQTAGQTPLQPRPKGTKKTRQTHPQRIKIGHFMAAVVLGIVVAAIVRTLIVGSELPHRSKAPSQGRYGTTSTLDTFDGRDALADHPIECLRHSIDSGRLLIDTETGRSLYPLSRVATNCCGQCHNGAAITMGKMAQAELHRNCAACHEWISP
jgi:hypothetical protein